jgi:hypothetical protein
LGWARIVGETFTRDEGDWGEAETPGTINIYGECVECPAFVQAKTGNVVGVSVEFDVDVLGDKVTAVRRTTPSTAEQMMLTPAQPWMAGCLGPMPYAEAKARGRQIWNDRPPATPGEQHERAVMMARLEACEAVNLCTDLDRLGGIAAFLGVTLPERVSLLCRCRNLETGRNSSVSAESVARLIAEEKRGVQP